MVSPL
jgi:hypothetical protein